MCFTLWSADSFSKADLLASWFELICAEFARESRLLCRVEGVRRMLFSGGFCENANARKLLTAYWIVNQAFYQKVPLLSDSWDILNVNIHFERFTLSFFSLVGPIIIIGC